MSDVISPPSIFTDGVDVSGPGYLAGELPGGNTTLQGVPTAATVMVFYEIDSGDWQLVRSVQSAPDGTWRVTDLNPDLTFNVVGRLAGHNDVIVTGLAPTRTDQITYSGTLQPTANFDGVEGSVLIVGGLPPYTATVIQPLPFGLSPVIDGRLLLIDGVSDDDGLWNSVVRVTASNGPYVDVPVTVLIGLKSPLNFAAAYAAVNDWEIKLSWIDQCSFEQGFRLYRSTSPIDPANLPAPYAVLPPDTEQYLDADLVYGETYYYRLGVFYGTTERITDEAQRLAKWTPDVLGAVHAWYDPASDVTDISGLCSQWNDISGNDRHVTQGGASLRPAIGIDADGIRYLEFPAASRKALANTSASTRSLLVNTPGAWGLCVARANLYSTTGVWPNLFAFWQSTSVRFGLATGYPAPANNTPFLESRFVGSTNYGATWPAVVTGPLIQFGQVDCSIGQVLLSVNGGVPVTSAAPTPQSNSTASDLYIGSPQSYATANADIYMVMFGSGAVPSAAHRERLIGWAAHRMGWLDILPADHPYKTTPP